MNLRALLPGVTLTAIIAFLGVQSSERIGVDWLGFSKSPISGIMMAILIGLAARLRQLRALGLRPFYVGFGAAVCVGALSLASIALLGALGAV